MYLRMPALWLMLLGLPALIIWPTPRLIALWLLGVLALVCLDAFLAPKPELLTITRDVIAPIRLGQETASTLRFRSPTRRAITVECRDAWALVAGASNELGGVHIPTGGEGLHRTILKPQLRGEYRTAMLTLRTRGPLRLAGRQRNLRVPGSLLVLPPFHSRRYLASRLRSLRQLDGQVTTRLPGAGSEFDSLRAYVPGDDVRAIDWHTTARRGEAVVRTWRPERDHQILIVLDAGRLGASVLEESTHFEHSLDAALLLASLAQRAGDRVSVLTHGQSARSVIHGESASGLINRMATDIAPIQPRLEETDWVAVTQQAQRLLRHRGLVVILSSASTLGGDPAALRHLGALASKHTLLIAQAEDPEIAALAAKREEMRDLYIAASVAREQIHDEIAAQELQARGCHVLTARVDSFAPALADRYVALKSAGLA